MRPSVGAMIRFVQVGSASHTQCFDGQDCKFLLLDFTISKCSVDR